MPSVSEFHQSLLGSLQAGTFVKITLSEPLGTEPGLRNLRARLVELKEGKRLSVVESFATREVTKNHRLEEGAAYLANAFTSSWCRAHLFTTGGDFQFRRERSGKFSVRAQRPTFSAAPQLQHDRVRPEEDALFREPFLQRLGVTNVLGKPRPGMAGKLRQIQRFSELLGHLLEDWVGGGGSDHPESRLLKVADMGAGKGYLTFILAREFKARGWSAEIVGVEQRPELVESSNQLAADLGFSRLRFECGSIGQWRPAAGLDVLVALHACNTATDDALFQGVSAGAQLLLTSPCCHQEIRPQLSVPAPLAAVLDHGILLERQAEILTDGLRALLLELRGYRARVFEFVEPEHSGKNLMLAATRRKSVGRSVESIRDELRAVMKAFGIREQRLASLLEEWP